MRSLQLAAVLTAAALAACRGTGEPKPFERASELPPENAVAVVATVMQRQPITAVPKPPHEDARKVALGAELFTDTRLSGDGTVSCASCHDLGAHAGADPRARSIGAGGTPTARNAPALVNAALSSRLFWDGRARSLEEQVDGPLLGSEMKATWSDVVGRLAGDPSIARRFAEIYGRSAIEPAQVRDAIASYERTLVATGSRFDRWLAGDTRALSADEVAGYRLFVDRGCASCHQGANAGGNMFQELGVMESFFSGAALDDVGRFAITGDPADRHVFRVPGLRTATRTAPYFHDGSVATLDEAIRLMGVHQLGVDLPPDERTKIAVFLGSLEGTLEGRDEARDVARDLARDEGAEP